MFLKETCCRFPEEMYSREREKLTVIQQHQRSRSPCNEFIFIPARATEEVGAGKKGVEGGYIDCSVAIFFLTHFFCSGKNIV